MKQSRKNVTREREDCKTEGENAKYALKSKRIYINRKQEEVILVGDHLVHQDFGLEMNLICWER